MEWILFGIYVLRSTIAEKEFGVSCEVLMPPKGVVDQKKNDGDFVSQGIKGIVIGQWMLKIIPF